MATKVRHNAADPLMELLCVLSDVPIRFDAIRSDLRAHGYSNYDAIRRGLQQLATKHKLNLIQGHDGRVETVRVHPAHVPKIRELGQGYWSSSRRSK